MICLGKDPLLNPLRAENLFTGYPKISVIHIRESNMGAWRKGRRMNPGPQPVGRLDLNLLSVSHVADMHLSESYLVWLGSVS